MDYQLVLQFPGDALSDYDLMIEAQNRLIEALGDTGDVAGHETGTGEINLFIRTSRPEAAFLRAKVILESLGLINQATAAYRTTDGDVYTLVWPADSSRPFVVA